MGNQWAVEAPIREPWPAATTPAGGYSNRRPANGGTGSKTRMFNRYRASSSEKRTTFRRADGVRADTLVS